MSSELLERGFSQKIAFFVQIYDRMLKEHNFDLDERKTGGIGQKIGSKCMSTEIQIVWW